MTTFTTASKTPLIVKTGFKNYDFCANPYVGCQMGCKYCYVRFFIKDKQHGWGDFVRIRKHVKDKFETQLNKIADMRLVIGTMTDPWQPVERKERITRQMLEIIRDTKGGRPSKVGVFTRSPIVLEDVDLIKQMPRARVHYTLSPYDKDVMQMIEPVAVSTKRRLETVLKLKQAGIRVHVNIAPAIPFLSDHLVDDTAKAIAAIGVDEFFVDPMQAYDQSFKATETSLQSHPDWALIKETMLDEAKYNTWKDGYKDRWVTAWKKWGSKNTLPIWSDHANDTWVDMNTNKSMSTRIYGDDV